MNPSYQLPELEYCLKKVDIKAIIAPETYRKQKHYEMLMTLGSGPNKPRKSSLENVIIHSDKQLP